MKRGVLTFKRYFFLGFASVVFIQLFALTILLPHVEMRENPFFSAQIAPSALFSQPLQKIENAGSKIQSLTSSLFHRASEIFSPLSLTRISNFVLSKKDPTEVLSLAMLDQIQQRHQDTRALTAEVATARPMLPDLQPASSTHLISQKLPKNESLESFLQKQRLNPQDKEKALSAWNFISNQKNNAFRSGEIVDILSNEEGRLLSLRLRDREKNQATIQRTLHDGFSSTVSSKDSSETQHIISGVITRSFVEAADRASLPREMVDDFVDLFSNRVEFRKDLQPGDRFSVVLSNRNASIVPIARNTGEQRQTSQILAASITVRGKAFFSIRHIGQDGRPRYFDENGNTQGGSFLRYPVQFTRISSVFTTARFHPVLKIARPHNGVDFAAPTGTPVRTVGDGTIVFAGYDKECGNVVKVQHNNRYVTAYLHLSKISSSIRKGASVTQGQVIGAVGMTGLATGPHLHFSLYDNGMYVDPLKANLPYMIERENMIPTNYLQIALRTLREQHDLVQVALAPISGRDKRA